MVVILMETKVINEMIHVYNQPQLDLEAKSTLSDRGAGVESNSKEH